MAKDWNTTKGLSVFLMSKSNNEAAKDSLSVSSCYISYIRVVKLFD